MFDKQTRLMLDCSYNFPCKGGASPGTNSDMFTWNDSYTVQMNEYCNALQNSFEQRLLSSVMNTYCWWNSPQEIVSSLNTQISNNYFTFSQYADPCWEAKNDNAKVKPRKRRNSLPEVTTNLNKILKKINEGTFMNIFSSEKTQSELRSNFSRRRSQYIGVSKNGQNWQVLINMGNTKKYIGTYSTEKEGAIAYDFYSIALHNMKSKTNFNYSTEFISEMINSYFENGKQFEPSKFVDQVY